MRMRALAGPVAAVVVVWLVLQVALSALAFDPSPLALAGCVALAGATAWLATEAAGATTADWGVPVVAPTRRAGQDRRLGTLLRVVESHLASSEPDPTLAGQLRELARSRLAAHRGVPADLPDSHPDVLTGLGPELADLFARPPRRLRPAEIARALDRIEEL